MLELLGRGRWAIEIKRSLAARPGKGFHLACEDIAPARRFIVYSGEERYPVSQDAEAVGVREMAAMLAK